MTFLSDQYKMLLISAAILGVTLLHFVPIAGRLGTHLVHRELYFFPILLAGFWFGFRGGIITSICVSIVYTIQFALTGRLPDVITAVSFQVLIFLAVGLFLGWMVDRQERRRKERDMINDAFGKYIPPAVRDEILSGNIPLDGEFKQVTVLFADLRNFTLLVESHGPRAVVRIMNQYFKEMTEAIRNHGGMVLQFVGDEIEAVFGAPLAMDHHSRKAIQAAIEMRIRLEVLNRQFAANGMPQLRHGIGIHSGPVLAGNIGSPDRLSYAMVGDTVNLASRIQEINKRFDTDILVSASTKESMGNGFELTKLQPVSVKGFKEPVDLFKIC